MSAAVLINPRLQVAPRNSEPWITTSPDGPSSDKVASDHSSPGESENVLEDDTKEDSATIKWVTKIPGAIILTRCTSDAISLKQGIITFPPKRAKALYTILLVGETGVGKSSVIELIANALAGNDIDHYDSAILDHTNQKGGSNNQSQTSLARFYEFTSKNGIVVSGDVLNRGGYA